MSKPGIDYDDLLALVDACELRAETPPLDAPTILDVLGEKLEQASETMLAVMIVLSAITIFTVLAANAPLLLPWGV